MRLASLKRGLEIEVERCREDNNAVDMAKAYVTFRETWELIETASKEAKKVFDHLSQVDFPEALQLQGLANVALEDAGRTIGVQVRTKASIIADAKMEAIDYLRADHNAVVALEIGDKELAGSYMVLGGRYSMAKRIEEVGLNEANQMIDEIRETTKNLEALVVDHVFPQTLSSVAKDLAEEGIELPDDKFRTYLQPTTTWRKITPKK
ncbi:MAG: hypothetical protein ACR2QF_15950 [Geminicoccaceae bacterium]